MSNVRNMPRPNSKGGSKPAGKGTSTKPDANAVGGQAEAVHPAALTAGRPRMSVRYETAMAGLQLIAKGAVEGDLAEWNISPKDWETLTGSTPWVGKTQTCKRALDQLMHATMFAQGLPQFEPPAEYIAAVIAMFVSPTNLMPACRLMESRKSADELASTGLKRTEDITPERLFALCLQLASDDRTLPAIQQWEKRVNLRIKHIEESGSKQRAKDDTQQ